MNQPARRLVLMTRPGCHLCHRLEQLVRDNADGPVELISRDITTDRELMAKWKDRIPVVLEDDRVLLEGRPDEDEVAEVVG
ncbi:MAG: glutaredoxin family protein [Phycisphaeraceae bacterium]|nr:glutaredoxin family protein [Phycisphaeraceae bacterium]